MKLRQKREEKQRLFKEQAARTLQQHQSPVKEGALVDENE